MTDVADLISNQETAINGVMADAQFYLDSLLTLSETSFGHLPFSVDTLLTNIYAYQEEPIIPDPSLILDSGSIVDPPTFDSSLAEFPADPVYTFSAIPDVTVPTLAAVAPSLNYPTPPSATLPADPGAAPIFAPPPVPTAPTVVLPAVPTFAALNLPSAPSITMPAFDALAPTDDLLAPTAEFAFAEAAYESTLLDPLKAKLLSDLTSGGYGIETADEVALFNRARDREVEAMMSRIEDAGRAMSMRGFPLPPGELSIHMDQAYQMMQDKVSDVSRDITLQRNKLFVENRQFTIEQTRGLEQILIGFHNFVQERAMNVAKLTVEMSIAIFNALVERYKAKWQGYQTQATVFAERIRGELAKAEIYRTQIEAKGVEVQMQRQQVELYLAQLKGTTTAVDIYRIQVDAAAALAGIERLKLDAFRSQVEAYTARVQAKVAEFGLFRAQVEGEKARVDIFEAEVRAYAAQVAAAKSESDVRLARVQADTEQVRAKIALYQGTVTKYETDMRLKLQQGQLDADVYKAQMEDNRLGLNREIAVADIILRDHDIVAKQNIATQQVAVDNARVKLTAAVEAMKLKAETTRYASEKFFATLTAYIGTVNTLAVQSSTE